MARRDWRNSKIPGQIHVFTVFFYYNYTYFSYHGHAHVVEDLLNWDGWPNGSKFEALFWAADRMTMSFTTRQSLVGAEGGLGNESPGGSAQPLTVDELHFCSCKVAVKPAA